MTKVNPVPRSRIVGLRTSAGPLRNVVLEISDGVTALYGRNGAGKSWILDALGKASRGEHLPQTHLIVEVAAGSRASYWYSQITQRHGLAGVPKKDGPAMAMREWFTRGGRYFSPARGQVAVPEDLIGELQNSQYLALVPVGVTEPRWEVWICADAHPRPGSAIQRALEEFESIEHAVTTLNATAQELYDLPGLGPDEKLWNRVAAQVDALSATVGPETDNWGLDFMLNPPPFPSVDMTSDELTATVEGVENWIDDLFGGAFEAANSWAHLPIASWLWNNDVAVNPDSDHDFHPHSGKLLRNLVADALPFPVACVAEVKSIPWLVEDESNNDDLDERTSHHFAAALTGTMNDKAQAVSTTPEMESWAHSLTDEANTIYQSLLQDAPALELHLRQPYEWTIGTPVTWRVRRTLPGISGSEVTTTTAELPITRLSTAESRWASIAIRRALDRIPEAADSSGFIFRPAWQVSQQRSNVILLDEPEAALHRAAEQHMARGLDGLTVAGPQVVVSTHSPEILNRPEVSLVHVSRSVSGATQSRQMTRPNLEGAVQELGLRPSDLIGMYRVFLLVEGEHDEIVLRALLPEVLESARVKIIAIRGGVKLPSTTESQLLFDMTSAQMVAMLDNVSIARVEHIWDGAQQRYLTTGPDAAIEHLTGQLRMLKGDEYQWLSSWLSRALKKGVNNRLTPFGLEAQDIIEYLPVEELVPKAAKSWQELRSEHSAALPDLDPTKGLRDFKRWLTHTYKANTTVTSVQRAANALTEVPHEFVKLGHRLREISTRTPTG